MAFLAAVTVAVLLVRAGLSSPDPQPVTTATTPVATDTVAVTEPPTETRTTTGEGVRFYTIKRGDTLEGIAAQFGTSVETLLELNPEVDPVALTVGQKIRVG